MITTKQRAYLRSLANSLDSVLQLGKNGIEAGNLKQIEEVLELKELVKITVLETAGLEPAEAQRKICSALGCEGVQVIGRKIVIYKQAREKENRRIELPRWE